jgi:small-conductance mechanosensitive channel
VIATVGIGGLALSLAAKDTLADAIAGITLLVDRPFRPGDRIEIPGLDTWGDVVSIGVRTTRVRTRDNRLVIVPNAAIAKDQVVNYTYPDPRYRVELHVGLAYGTDVERARRVIIDTVRQIDGVLPDRPVDAIYHQMGDSAMIFRVRWWIESYVDTNYVFDRVNTALQTALDDAGIDTPFPTRSVSLQFDRGAAEKPSGTPGDDEGKNVQ